jgi:hypothetical protein
MLKGIAVKLTFKNRFTLIAVMAAEQNIFCSVCRANLFTVSRSGVLTTPKVLLVTFVTPDKSNINHLNLYCTLTDIYFSHSVKIAFRFRQLPHQREPNITASKHPEKLLFIKNAENTDECFLR